MAINLSVQFESALGPSGPTYVAADAGGHTFANDGETAIWVKNLSASSINLVMASARDSDFGPYPSKTIAIAASTIFKTQTFNARRFTSPVTGLATFTLSATASVEVAAVAQQQIFKDS